jgi:type IV pilus assembly protein PilE
MRKQRGITLMELMVVMVIVAILTAIAYPSYQQQVRRTNRSSAKTALTQTAQSLERCFTRLSRYDDAANCPIANNLDVGGTFNTPDGTYQISGNVVATSFDLTATPQGRQATDSCGNFMLDETGARTVSMSTVAMCWNR